MTTIEPTVVDRPTQPYVAIKKVVTMRTIPEIADRIPDVFGWLAERGIEPTGAPFLKFNVIDMERELEIEAGVPVSGAVEGDGTVLAGELPGGSYVTLTHIGHPDELIDATAALLAWADRQGLDWDAADTPAGRRWGARLEIYHTNPIEEPDLNKWTTELAFRLA